MLFYERCLADDPIGLFVPGRYETAHSVVALFDYALHTGEHLEDIKEWLGRIYCDNDEDVRGAVICGALEHILEDKRAQKIFSDWKTDPVLSLAYNDAMQWAIEHDK